MFANLHFSYSPNSFCYRGSYFKYRGGRTQISVDAFCGGLSGRVSSEVSSDVQFGVYG